jgi:hypothetical protein
VRPASVDARATPRLRRLCAALVDNALHEARDRTTIPSQSTPAIFFEHELTCGRRR